MSRNLSIPSARVYVEYDKSSPPPHPGRSWTRFVCISDTHSRTFPVPAGDVLLHAGDLSSWGYPEQLGFTVAWLKTLEHPTKIIIAGNHDLCLDANKQHFVSLEGSTPIIQQLMKSRDVRDAGIHYLEHEFIKFRTFSGREWTVYGSPAAPEYARGAFQYSTAEEANEIYQRIPPETEILLTHTPPYMILDTTRLGKHAGCLHLAQRVKSLQRCQLHVFGHIHECSGAEILPSGADGWRVAVNAALARGTQAIIVDLRN